MSPRLLRNLAVALVVGIALWWGMDRLGRGRVPAPLAGAGGKEKIAKIEILRPGAALTIENLEGWQVTAPRSDDRPVPANAGAVARLVDVTANLRLEETITENPSRYPSFEVDEASGLRLRATGKDGAVLLDLIVGKASSDGNRMYVRRPVEAAVRLTGGTDPTAVRRDTQDWFDRTLLRFDPAAVTSVEIRGRAGRVSLVRAGAGLDPARSSWTVNGLPASTTAVQNYIHSFSGAWADEVALGSAPPAGFGFEKPRVVLTLTDSLGPHTLAVGSLGSAARRYVRATPTGILFLVSDAAVQTWDKPAKAFR